MKTFTTTSSLHSLAKPYNTRIASTLDKHCLYFLSLSLCLPPCYIDAWPEATLSLDGIIHTRSRQVLCSLLCKMVYFVPLIHFISCTPLSLSLIRLNQQKLATLPFQRSSVNIHRYSRNYSMICNTIPWEI